MKYPKRPCNITRVQPSSHFDLPYCVIWWDVEVDERQVKLFRDLRSARRFRRKLERIRKSNMEARYATA